MIKRKMQMGLEKEAKTFAPRKKKIKIDISLLPDAVVDGKLIVPLGGKVFFERKLGGATKIHEGKITCIYEDKGIVEIFDETIDQFYAFSLNQTIPVIKKAD